MMSGNHLEWRNGGNASGCEYTVCVHLSTAVLVTAPPHHQLPPGLVSTLVSTFTSLPSMTSVKLYVYDLSQGMAKQMSLNLTGRQIGMYKIHVECFPFVVETDTLRHFYRRYLAHIGGRFRPRIFLWTGHYECDTR
jgi:hypothetical protein